MFAAQRLPDLPLKTPVTSAEKNQSSWLLGYYLAPEDKAVIYTEGNELIDGTASFNTDGF
jgi:hypothetical protein